MFDRLNAKLLAKEQLRGAFWPLCLISFAPILLSVALSTLLPGLGSLAAYLITPMMSIGVALIFLKRANNRAYTVSQVFTFYPLWWKAFKTFLFINVQVFVWSLLFIIPGIIEGLRCSMTFYILAENPDLSENEAIALSKDMTRGKIWDLIVFEFSLIGWYLLIGLTSGLAALWVMPYHTAAYTNIYLMLKHQYRNDYQARY